jgi:dihydropteroate synthase
MCAVNTDSLPTGLAPESGYTEQAQNDTPLLWHAEEECRFQVRDIVSSALAEEFERVGFDAHYRRAAERKFHHRVVKASGLSAPAANILKQTCLSLGAEAAVHKHAIDCKIEGDRASLLISATTTQLDRILQKCKPQPFALPKMAAAIQRQQQRQKVLQASFEPNFCAILNLTPDSFSDGGRFQSLDTIIETVAHWVELGVTWIDVGGESTRPGAQAVSIDQELARVIPVLSALTSAFPRLRFSIDTRHARVAASALETGATIVNDVSGLTWDSDMRRVVADAGCLVIMMHSQGTPQTMQDSPHYPNDDVVGAVAEFFYRQIDAAFSAGIRLENIMCDPGFGFGKTQAHNLTLLRCLPELVSIGFPVMAGFSRKRFLEPRARTGLLPEERDYLTAAVMMHALHSGVHVIRAHNVDALWPVFQLWKEFK